MTLQHKLGSDMLFEHNCLNAASDVKRPLITKKAENMSRTHLEDGSGVARAASGS